MQEKAVVEKMMVGGSELCRGGTSVGKMRGEKVNYAEEDSDGGDEGKKTVMEKMRGEEVNYADEDTEGEDGGSELCRRGQ